MVSRLLLISLCVLAVAALPARAVVPPKDCGRITVKHKVYDIKADQLPCKDAKAFTRHFLKSHDKPKGYSCQTYGKETQLKFRCEKGIKVFFAIKR